MGCYRLLTNGLIEQYGYEDYSSDVARDTKFCIAYNDANTYVVVTGNANKSTGGDKWGYPISIINRTNTQFKMTSNSNITNARIYYQIKGY